MGMQPSLFIYFLFLIAFAEKWQSLVVPTGTVWLSKSKIFIICPFTEEICLFLVLSVDHHEYQEPRDATKEKIHSHVSLNNGDTF